ncbi:DUF6221 family protein [Streptomyces aureus]|uniref:DUF6221 family protein n=1 Tax=Streptomyces aureus TaxID=193461 RepID=UPI000ACF5B82|nr:DUF6221 family protein [Streptomyces aureus]
MTDLERMAVWLRDVMDAAELAAQKAAEVCGCHPPAPSWSFRDGDEPTDGRILVVDDPHPRPKRKIGRRWNTSYEGLFMAQHIVRHDPAAVLRRIAADRMMLADLERITKGDYIDDGELPLAEHVIRRLAEGYGWPTATEVST